MKVTILEPKGYCAGVNNAISLALKIKTKHSRQPVTVLGMLVHNSYVTDFLKEKGINMIDDINNISRGVVIFAAHGHRQEWENIAQEKGLIIYDAICPLVKKNLQSIIDETHNQHQIIYIGYRSHPETVAALSYSSSIVLYDINQTFDYQLITDESPLVINQTTLNYLSLKDTHAHILSHLPHARIENEICNATRTRQEAILNIKEDVDAIIVIGDHHSSNSRRLFEIAKMKYPRIDSYLVEDVSQLDPSLLKNKNHIAISSGASTPLFLIDEVYHYLLNLK